MSITSALEASIQLIDVHQPELQSKVFNVFPERGRPRPLNLPLMLTLK